jgi:uncharacterized protein (DUF305 family)
VVSDLRRLLPLVAFASLWLPSVAVAQPAMDHTGHDHHQPQPQLEHQHGHTVGPAGSTYDLRWIDAMVQHHTGALRMSEFVFNVGSPGVGALANSIWSEQASEIKAMGQWRKAWYPEATVYPVTLKSGGNPNAMADLTSMSTAQIQAMQMMGSTPNRENRVTWFLEGMIAHHGGALVMAHDALKKSSNPTIQRLARQIIVAQRKEIIELRRMLKHDGLDKPEYYQFEALSSY